MKAAVNYNKRGFGALIIIAILALAIIGRLAYLQLVKGDEYTAKAESQQLGDNEIKASRGTIYDANMNVLAQSASVWSVYINPSKIPFPEMILSDLILYITTTPNSCHQDRVSHCLTLLRL